jgi:hypothetical protein
MTIKLNIRFRLPAITPVLLAIFGSAMLASPGHAAVFNDLTSFTNAAIADGIATTTDNFSTYIQGDIANAQRLGKFTYSFDSNLSDPTGTQPTIGVDGPNQVLTGAPFGAFVGGNSVQLTFTSGKTLLAFGATFTYAPADEPLLANLYNLGILDGSGATTIGNPAGLDAGGGSFFLGFIGATADEFSQVSLFSLVNPPNGTTGSPFLIPAYEVNNLVFGSAALVATPAPSSLGLLATGLIILASLRRRRGRSPIPRQVMKRGNRKESIMITISPSGRRAAQYLAVICSLTAMSMALPAWALGSTPVTVVNPTTSPVPTTDIANPALQPFQTNLLPNSTTSNQCVANFTVPAGKRLVIEYYSSQAQDTSGGGAGLTLSTTAGGNEVAYLVYTNSNTTNVVNQVTRIYADPGTIVQAFAFNPGTGHSCAASINISGYLVNVP